jgi:hypothetical protein
LVMVTMHGVPQQATGHTTYMIDDTTYRRYKPGRYGISTADRAERDLTLTHECTCYRATRCTLRHTDKGVVRQRVHWWVPASMPLPYENVRCPALRPRARTGARPRPQRGARRRQLRTTC